MAMRVMVGVIAALILTGGRSSTVPAAPEEQPREAPACSDAIEAYAARLQVGPPRRYENLTLYPIFADEVVVPEVDLTLDEAMERGLLEVRELKRAEVSRVRVCSRAKEPVFVMGGEMLGGAKQDRIVGDDLIVPPGSELVIPVFCVEHGRWVVKSEAFSSARMLAGSEVRKARQRADQGAVWSGVAAEQERLNAPSETGAMRSIQESKEVQDKVGPYRHAFSDLPEDLPRARGAVACVGGEIIAADLFGSRSVFRQLWPKLLESYALDAIDRERRGKAPDAVRIKRWLEGVKRAERVAKDTPGEGRLYELRGGGVIGSALVYDEGVVHMELFRGYVVRPTPFNRLEFRRERLEQQPEPSPNR